jgi:hypothetical protein
MVMMRAQQEVGAGRYRNGPEPLVVVMVARPRFITAVVISGTIVAAVVPRIVVPAVVIPAIVVPPVVIAPAIIRRAVIGPVVARPVVAARVPPIVVGASLVARIAAVHPVVVLSPAGAPGIRVARLVIAGVVAGGLDNRLVVTGRTVAVVVPVVQVIAVIRFVYIAPEVLAVIGAGHAVVPVPVPIVVERKVFPGLLIVVDRKEAPAAVAARAVVMSGAVGQVELLVSPGQAERAVLVGGALRLRRKAADHHVRLEIPWGDCRRGGRNRSGGRSHRGRRVCRRSRTAACGQRCEGHHAQPELSNRNAWATVHAFSPFEPVSGRRSGRTSHLGVFPARPRSSHPGSHWFTGEKLLRKRPPAGEAPSFKDEAPVAARSLRPRGRNRVRSAL